MNPALLLLVDGRFPAGGHTNSAGVEAAVALGDARDHESLERYLIDRLATTGRVDAAFAAHTAGASCQARNPALERRVRAADAEYDARVLSPHLRSTSRTFGRQLLRAGRPIWPHPLVDAVADTPGGPHQAIALGALVGAAGGTPIDAASIAFHHLASAVTTAAVRLLGLDPMAVAAIQARGASSTEPFLAETDTWADADPADLPADGGSLTEILGDDHARWDARLFVA